MRRTAAGIATLLLAAVAISGPLASVGQAGPATLKCGAGSPPAACALLDKLSAQLKPTAPLLGVGLADLTGPAQGFAARSDQPAGVPVAEVLTVATSLSKALGVLPGGVEALVGQTKLDGLNTTLTQLIGELSAPVAPVTGGQQSAGTSKPTPAKVSPSTPSSSSTSSAPRTSSSSTLGGSASTPSSSAAPSSATVPNVPVGDPLSLAPLGMPDFGFSQTFQPVTEPLVTPAALTPAAVQDAALADAVGSLPHHNRRTELAVVVVLSLLLIAGAGIAQLQQNRHVIPD
jgi:hypothetical protein